MKTNLLTEEKFYILLDECFDELTKFNEIFTVFENDKRNNSIEGIKSIADKIKMSEKPTQKADKIFKNVYFK